MTVPGAGLREGGYRRSWGAVLLRAWGGQTSLQRDFGETSGRLGRSRKSTKTQAKKRRRSSERLRKCVFAGGCRKAALSGGKPFCSIHGGGHRCMTDGCTKA
eukprot:670081-Prorocentrum_minimum.AAC.1